MVIGGLIVLVLFTALIAPRYVDWTSFRKDFEREASRIIGQKVEVLGDTSINILPLPSITFGGLAIGRNKDDSPLMTVDQFAMDVELMPMLRGQLRIVELKLLRPRLNLFVDENGSIAWTDRSALQVDPDQIKLDKFNIINGEVKIRGLAGGRVLSLEQLDGQISAKSLYGPWRIRADGYLEDARARFDITTGRLQDDGSIRIKLGARRADLPYRISLDGPMQVSEGILRWQGEFELAAQDSGDNANKGALPIFSQGKFSATPQAVDVPEFRLEIGGRDDPYVITGAGSAEIGKTVSFQVKAEGRQIDLDRVAEAGIEGDDEGGLNLTSRLKLVRTLLERVPVPSAEGVIELSLPAIIAGDTLIRQVSAVISPDNEGWEIRRLGAILPGNTKFEASGRVGLRQAFGFSGKILAASRQPTGLATWLGKRNNAFLRNLRTAGLSADVVISDKQVSLEKLELVLNEAVLRGKLQRLSADNERPAIIARLEGDDINLDDLRAVFTLVANDDAEAIASHDLDITLKAGRLRGFDISAQDVETRFRIFGGSVSIEKLNASDFFGSKLISSGRIDDVLLRPNGNFKLAVKAEDGEPLLQYVRGLLPDNRILNALTGSGEMARNLDLKFELDANSSNLASNLSGNPAAASSKGRAFVKGSLGDTRLDVLVEFDGSPAVPEAVKLDISSILENNNPATLLAQLGVPVLPIKTAGPLKISANFSGAAKDGMDSFITAQMPGINASASGNVGVVGDNAGASELKLTFGALDIEPLLAMAGGTASGINPGKIATSFTADMKIEKNVIAITNAVGQANSSEFSGNLQLEVNANSNHRISGRLESTRLDLPMLAGIALTPGEPIGSGKAGDWNTSSFGAAMLSGVDGKLVVKIDSSDFGIGKPAKNVSAELVLVDGSVNINDARGEWMGGNFEAEVSLINKSGVGGFGSQYKFANIDARALGRAIDMAGFGIGRGGGQIESRMDLTGNVEGSGRSVAAIVSSLTGSGTMEMRGVKISALNTSPLAHIFDVVDAGEFEIQDENVLPVLGEVIDRGSVEIAEISLPFIISTGKIRARNIAASADGAVMNGAVELNIATREMDSEVSIKFDPGNEWVEGAQPEITLAWQGAFNSPARSIDVQPLSEFLSLRNFEREQRRVDLLQAAILEKQRLRNDIIVTNARVRFRQRLREEELHRQRQALLRREAVRLREFARLRHEKLLEAEAKAREDERLRLEEIARLELQAAERKRLAEEARRLKLARLEEEKRIAQVAAKAEAARVKKIRQARLAALAEQKRIADKAEKARAVRLRREKRANAPKPAPKPVVRQSPPQREVKPVPQPKRPPVAKSFAERLNEFLENR